MNELSTTNGLVQRARAGDESARNDLFDRAADRVHFYLHGRVGSRLRARMDVVDLLQDTFLRAHRVFDEFRADDDRDFVAWLCLIAENCVRDAVKHAGAAKRNPRASQRADGGTLESPGRPGANSIARLREQRTGPYTAALREEGRERLAAAIEQLDERARVAILLRFFADATVDEVAAAIETSATSTRRILADAIRETGRVLREGSHE